MAALHKNTPYKGPLEPPQELAHISPIDIILSRKLLVKSRQWRDFITALQARVTLIPVSPSPTFLSSSFKYSSYS